MTEIKPSPDKAIHPDKLDTHKKCPVCLTIYPIELKKCPMCRGKDGPKSGYYVS